MPQCNYYTRPKARYTKSSEKWKSPRTGSEMFRRSNFMPYVRHNWSALSSIMPYVRHNWSALSNIMPDVRHNCSAMSDFLAGFRHNFFNSSFSLERPAYECPAKLCQTLVSKVVTNFPELTTSKFKEFTEARKHIMTVI